MMAPKPALRPTGLRKSAVEKKDRKCQKGELHGPYWYAYRRVRGKIKSKYIGTKLKVGKNRSEKFIGPIFELPSIGDITIEGFNDDGIHEYPLPGKRFSPGMNIEITGDDQTHLSFDQMIGHRAVFIGHAFESGGMDEPVFQFQGTKIRVLKHLGHNCSPLMLNECVLLCKQFMIVQPCF